MQHPALKEIGSACVEVTNNKNVVEGDGKFGMYLLFGLVFDVL